VTLARQGVPHPDPSVAGTALAAVRAVQRWYEVVAWCCFAGLVLSLLAYLGSLHEPDNYATLVMLGLVLAWSGLATMLMNRWGISPAASPWLEGVSARDVVARTSPARPTPLTVTTRPRARRLWIAAAGAAVLYTIVFRGFHNGDPDPDPWREELLSAICPMATFGFALIGRRLQLPPWARRRPRGGRPLLVLDGAGIALPHLGVTLPWTQVASVDLQVIRQPGLFVHIADADLGVPVTWLSEPPERVLSVARDHLAAARAATPAES
jgi:hypothetical protein